MKGTTLLGILLIKKEKVEVKSFEKALLINYSHNIIANPSVFTILQEL